MAERRNVVELPTPLTDAHEVRSTLVCVSLQTMRAHGHLAAYMKALPPERAAEVEGLVPGVWRPVELAKMHYLTCDAVPLSPEERELMGLEVGRRLKESLVSTIARLSRQAGATPWVVLENLHRLNGHTWKGGGFAVYGTGPKDAIVEWHGQPCASSQHFLIGYVGFVHGLVDLFCRRSFVKLVTDQCTSRRIVCTVSWA